MSSYREQAEAIVSANDIANLSARVLAIEEMRKTGIYPDESEIERWVRDYHVEREKNVATLTDVLEADSKFLAMVDTFEDEETGWEVQVDAPCRLHHEELADECDRCVVFP